MTNTKIGRRFYISATVMIGIVLFIFIGNIITEKLNPLLYFLVYSIPSNMAISLFPHEPVLVFLGATYDPLLLAVLASIGTVIAGLLDYHVFVPLLAHNSLDTIKSTKGYQTSIRWFGYHPFLTIVIAGFTPVPFFIFKFIAFAAQYPLFRYQSALLVGRLPRYYLLALVGELIEIPKWIIVGVFIGMFLIYLVNGWSHILNFIRQRRELTAQSSVEEI